MNISPGIPIAIPKPLHQLMRIKLIHSGNEGIINMSPFNLRHSSVASVILTEATKSGRASFTRVLW
jgi:hypothetical protein